MIDEKYASELRVFESVQNTCNLWKEWALNSFCVMINEGTDVNIHSPYKRYAHTDHINFNNK